MIEINNILFPTDFSNNSLRAMHYAVDLAKKYDATLHIIHVTLGPDVVITYGMTQYSSEELKRRERGAVEANLAELLPADLGKPRAVVHRVLVGIPLNEILAYIKYNTVDLVVMGTHGHTGIKHLVLGSVAENVVRQSPVPVLTAHAGDEVV